MTLELAVKILLVLILIGSTLYIHLRGRVRYAFFRQLLDHSTFMAPINAMMYAFSSVPKTPYLPVESIPTLHQIKSNWETIIKMKHCRWKAVSLSKAPISTMILVLILSSGEDGNGFT